MQRGIGRVKRALEQHAGNSSEQSTPDPMPPFGWPDLVRERRTLAPLREDLDRLLGTIAMVDKLPARRADDTVLREAAQETREAASQLLLVVNRMEGHGHAAGEETSPPEQE